MTSTLPINLENLLRQRQVEGERIESMAALEINHRVHFTNSYLRPALETGLIEMTRPDKPKSRLQKYRLTPQGRSMLHQT